MLPPGQPQGMPLPYTNASTREGQDLVAQVVQREKIAVFEQLAHQNTSGA